MKHLERNDEEDFAKYALSRGCRAWKLIHEGRKGFLDRTVFMPGGRIFLAEFKIKGNETSPHQDNYIKILEKLGHKCYTPYSFNEAKEVLDSLL